MRLRKPVDELVTKHYYRSNELRVDVSSQTVEQDGANDGQFPLLLSSSDDDGSVEDDPGVENDDEMVSFIESYVEVDDALDA